MKIDIYHTSTDFISFRKRSLPYKWAKPMQTKRNKKKKKEEKIIC